MTEGLISVKEILGLVGVSVLPWLILGLPGIAGGKLSEVIWAFTPITMTALCVAVLFGLPSIILLNYLRLFRLGWYSLVGSGVGILLTGYFILPGLAASDFWLGWPSYLGQFIVMLFLSLLTTTIYWFLVRPDRVHGH